MIRLLKFTPPLIPARAVLLYVGLSSYASSVRVCTVVSVVVSVCVRCPSTDSVVPASNTQIAVIRVSFMFNFLLRFIKISFHPTELPKSSCQLACPVAGTSEASGVAAKLAHPATFHHGPCGPRTDENQVKNARFRLRKGLNNSTKHDILMLYNRRVCCSTMHRF